MRIITLIEDTSVNDKLYVGHGCSYFINIRNKNFIVGTGSDGRFLGNAKRMKMPVGKAEAVVICENHSSQSGGLDALLKINPKIRIFAKADAAMDYYEKSGVFKMQTGVSKSFFKKHQKNCVLYKNFSQVAEGFYLASPEDINEEYITKDKTGYVKKGSRLKQDDFVQESFCVIFPKERKREGCVIIAPCSHIGIINIINTVKMRWTDIPILAVIGGFHVMGKSKNKLNCTDEQMKELANQLRLLDVGNIYTNHCTGFKGYEMLKETLGDQIQYFSTGEELEF